MLIVLALAAALTAAEVGDHVQFERAGQKFSGKVVAARPGGAFLEVEVLDAGTARKVIVQAASVSVLTRSAPAGMRTWSDATGKFRVEATLESRSAFEVVLRKKDGTTIKVPTERLSVDDQEYVAGLDSPGENSRPSSPAPAAASSPRNTATKGKHGAFVLTSPAVFGKGGNLSIRKLPPPAGIQADPSPVDFSQVSDTAVDLAATQSGESIGRPLLIGSSGTQICCGVRTDRRSSDPSTKVFLIDGGKRTSRQVGALAGHNVWLCSSDPSTGEVLGVVMKDDKSSSLCVISGIAEEDPRIVAHWKMFPGDDKKSDYVRFRKLPGNQVAVTVYAGQVHAFDYDAGVEIWALPANAFNEPAISPGGKYAAVLVENQCAILETKTGKQIGSIPVSVTGPASLGFSPDGLRLAVANGNQVRVFEVASGEEQLLHEANVALAGMGKPVLWLGSEFLLLPTGILLGLERNMVVWKYNIDQDATEFADLEHHSLLPFTGRTSLGLVRLPHAAARKASQRDASGIAAARPGDPMTIVADASGPAVSSSDLRKWLGDAMSRAGYSESPSAPTQLVATIARGKTTTESYRAIGRGFGTQEVTFTPCISKVEIRQNGATLWQRSVTSSLPFMLSGSKSLQDAARECERPDPKFFQGIKLPRQILKPEYQSGFGSSRVSLTGVVD